VSPDFTVYHPGPTLLCVDRGVVPQDTSRHTINAQVKTRVNSFIFEWTKWTREPLINSESFKYEVKIRQIKAPIAGNSHTIGKIGNEELVYFNE